MSDGLRDVRCPHCRRLLFRALGGVDVEVKCKCGRIVRIRDSG